MSMWLRINYVSVRIIGIRLGWRVKIILNINKIFKVMIRLKIKIKGWYNV